MSGDSISGFSSLLGGAQYNATNALASARSPLDLANVSGDVSKVAEDFEAFYLTQVTANMFAGIETDPLFGGGPGEGVFRSLLTQEYGKIIARSGGVGIADSVSREIIKLQEAG